MYWSLLALPLLAAIQISNAQLTGSVGPLTTVAEKATIKTCNVLDYGAVADLSTDLGAPLVSAFNDCIDGGLVYIPEGSYAMSTWATLDKGTGWALQLDGIIYRNGTDGGNMIIIEHASDFEMFSSNSAGAMQGLGYEFHADGISTTTRLLRLQKVTSFSVHDIILVDAPAFHLVLDTVEDGEVYNVAIRAGNEGGLDGIDITGSNVWVHDVEVTNKDECVTVKSPSSNILVESVYCNWSGGCAMGSLGADTNISDITYRNIYTWSSNQMYMIKSNGGSGTVQNVLLENFIGHSNAYSLDIDTSWAEMSTASGDGVGYSNLTIKNWKGTESNGLQRGPIKVLCPAGNPCYDLIIEDFAMWTESGDSQTYTCSNAYGDGFCLASGDDYVAYTATPTTVTVAPSGYSAATMAADLTSAFGTASSIPIPTIPTTFFPGVTPYSALASASIAATASSISSARSAGDVSVVSSLVMTPTTTAAVTPAAASSATSTATATISPVVASVASSATPVIIAAGSSVASSVVSSVTSSAASPNSTLSASPSPKTSSASATVGVVSSISIPFVSSSPVSSSPAVSYTSFSTSLVPSTLSVPLEAFSTRVPEPEETEACPSGFEHESHDHVQDHGHGYLHRRRFGRH